MAYSYVVRQRTKRKFLGKLFRKKILIIIRLTTYWICLIFGEVPWNKSSQFVPTRSLIDIYLALLILCVYMFTGLSNGTPGCTIGLSGSNSQSNKKCLL